MYTLPETNSSPPENRPLEKEIPIGMLVLGRVHRLDLNCVCNPTSCFFVGCLLAYLFQKQFSWKQAPDANILEANLWSLPKETHTHIHFGTVLKVMVLLHGSWEIPGQKFPSFCLAPFFFQFHLGIPVFICIYICSISYLYTYAVYMYSIQNMYYSYT